jgi:hypothetical protein
MQTLLRPRLFSLREANAMVPTLQRTFVRARALRDDLSQVQAELREAGVTLEGTEIEVDPAAPQQIQRLQARAKGLVEQLMAALREVAELGIEVKAADGLCDFRSRHQGRTVLLCWRFGEDRITQFHELDTGFAGRKPLPDGGEFTGELMH